MTETAKQNKNNKIKVGIKFLTQLLDIEEGTGKLNVGVKLLLLTLT
jgi:hypothetical protein